MGIIAGYIRIQRLLSIAALLFFLSCAHAQPKKSLLYGYLDNINNFNQLFPQEKVYLHFDNTGYFMGETIWFKAYVLRDDKCQLTDLSKVLYVELVSPDGEIQDRQTLAVDDGTSSGCIHLDNLLMSGYYEVRAYTRYMTNWGKESVFSRVFPVFEKPSKQGDLSCLIENTRHKNRLPDHREKVEIKTAGCHVDFYPEGGHLIAGKKNQVAFLVTGSEGPKPFQKCALLSEQDTLEIFSTDQFGRGLFTITPSEAANRFLVLDAEDASCQFPLPLAEQSGCVLRINTLGDNSVRMEFEGTQDYLGRRLALVIMNRGNLIGVDTMTVGQTTVMRKIDKADLGDGVNEFIIIDSNGDILSDRMVFCYPRKSPPSLSAKILAPNQGNDRRRKAVFKAVPHLKFSVSIRDYDKDVNGEYGNISSWLLLSSDLKGYIGHPEYYLEADDREHRMAADLLMLVQGWRRYDVSMMLGRKTFYYEQPVEGSLSLHGRIHNRKEDIDVEEKAVEITMYGKSGQVLEGKCDTDPQGYFAFQMPDIYGEWTMFVDLQEKKANKKYFVSLDRNFSPECRYLLPEETSPQLTIPSAVTAEATDNTTVEYEEMDKKAHLIPTVNVKGRYLFKDARKSWESEKRGAYAASIYYDCVAEAEKIADTGAEPPGIFEWLMSKNEFFGGSTTRMYDTKNGSGERGDSLNVTDEYDRRRWDPNFGKKTGGLETTYAFNIDGKGKYYDPEITYGHYLLLERDGLSYKNRPVVWILDNAFYYVTYIPVSCKLYDIQGIPAATFEIMPENLDDFKSVYISENQEIWHRYLRLPKLEGMSPVTVFLYAFHSKGKKKGYLRKTHYSGFSSVETFEMPDYSVLPKADDFRRTLYWNPNVQADKNGNASLEFYNNSTCQRFVISAEGVTNMGIPVVFK